MSARTNQTTDARNVVEERYFKAKMARPGTFGNRVDWQITTQSPGPGIYNTRDTYSRGGKHRANAVPFSHINRDMPTVPGPGPANYSPLDVEKSTSKYKNAPAYSFKKRPIDNMSTASPGPAQYTVPSYFGGVSKESNKTNHPAVPFTPREHNARQANRAPGPAAYNVVDFDVYKNRAPTMKLLSGHGECFRTSAGPGPAAYRVKGEFDKLTEVPDFGFGGCHSRPQSSYSQRLSDDDERSLPATPAKSKTPQKRPPSSGRPISPQRTQQQQQQRPKTRESEETKYYEEAQAPGEKTSGKVGVVEVSSRKSGADTKKSTSRGANVQESTSQGASVKESTSQGANVKESSSKGANVKESTSRGASVKESSSRGANVKESSSRKSDISPKQTSSQKSNASAKSGASQKSGGGPVKEPLSVDDLQ